MGDEGLEPIESATVVIRHGARSAIHDVVGTSNPHFDCSTSSASEELMAHFGSQDLKPAVSARNRCKPGQLVERGFAQQVTLGEFFRSQYGAGWTASARATNYQRTQASAAAFLWGFLGEKAPQHVDYFEDVRTEPMFGASRGGPACDRATALADAQREAFAITPRLRAANLTAFFSLGAIASADWSVTDVADGVYSSACELGQPSCVDSACLVDLDIVALLLDEADRAYCDRYRGDRGGAEATRLAMYPFLDEIRDGLFDASPRSLTLYAGHDTVVSPLAAALGFFDCRWPPLAARITFELLEGRSHVRVLFNGRDVTHRLAGCPPKRCPLEVFSDVVDTLLPRGAKTFAQACGEG